MPLLFHPEVLELPLKQEATLHGTVPHLLLYAMMQQAVQNQQDPERQEGDPKGSEIESDDDE